MLCSWLGREVDLLGLLVPSEMNSLSFTLVEVIVKVTDLPDCELHEPPRTERLLLS